MAAVGCDTSRQVRQVWTWNLDREWKALLSIVKTSGSSTLIAIDTEFPGFFRERPDFAPIEDKYEALRSNVDIFRPIQLGLAVVGEEKALLGVWNFNLQFDLNNDLHTQKAVEFLCRAGIVFPRHAEEGICAMSLGRRLAASPMVRDESIGWLTFSGLHDLGYLTKMLTGKALPPDKPSFDEALASFCPLRYELRDRLPYGSLESLVQEHGVERRGAAHTAGSDALATAELFLRVAPESHFAACTKPIETEQSDNASAPRATRQVAGVAAITTAERTAREQYRGAALRAYPVLPTNDIGSRAAPSSCWGAAAREAALHARATAASGRLYTAINIDSRNNVEVS